MNRDECLSADETRAFLDGDLGAERSAFAEVHLAGCAECRELLAYLARLDMVPLDEREDEVVRALDEATRPAVLRFVRATIAARAPEVAEAPAAVRPLRASRRAWGLLGWAVAAAIAVAAGLAFWHTSTPEEAERSARLFAAETRDERASAFRLADAPYSPYKPERGARPERGAEALAAARKAVDANASAPALRALGRAYLLRGDSASAASTLARAAEAAPGDASIAVDYAATLGEAGRYDEAIRVLDGVLAREPARADALFDRALANDREGRREDAERDWRRYLAADAASPWAVEVRDALARRRESSN